MKMVLLPKFSPLLQVCKRDTLLPNYSFFLSPAGVVIVNSVNEIPDRAQVIYLASLSPILFNGISAPVLSDIPTGFRPIFHFY
jgi:hypothetical protein